MTKDELLTLLRTYAKSAEDGDYNAPEVTHRAADDALLAFINDPEITAAFEAICKWYA